MMSGIRHRISRWSLAERRSFPLCDYLWVSLRFNRICTLPPALAISVILDNTIVGRAQWLAAYIQVRHSMSRPAGYNL